MKRVFFAVFVFSFFLLNSCGDTSTFSVITIKNESSYGLRVDFVTINNYITGHGGILEQYKEINIKKDESVQFCLEALGSQAPRDPNNELSKIIFVNLADDQVIKEIENKKDLFIKTTSDKSTVDYLLEINDDLLL